MQHVIRASRRAAAAKTSNSRRKVGRFIMADPSVPQKRKADDDDEPIARLRAM